MKIDLYLIVSGQTKVRSAKLEAVRARIEAAHDVVTTVISNHEPEDISPKMVRESVVLERINSPLYDSFLRTLGPKQVSNSMKHLEALKGISTNTRSGAYPIVLEDDPLLPDNFETDFQKMFDEIPSSWDFVCLGLPGSAPGFQTIENVYKALPVCNAYMIKQSLASKLSNTFLPLRYIANIHMSYSLEAFGVKPLLYSPQLFIDGSKYGVYVSTLTASNDLIFNKEYVQAKKQVSDGNFRDALFTINGSPLSNHPDFLHLKALCELQVDGKEAAARTFEAAMKVLEENNAVINNESKFLADYIELYRPAA
jgi:hypothetical protein